MPDDPTAVSKGQADTGSRLRSAKLLVPLVFRTQVIADHPFLRTVRDVRVVSAIQH